MGTEAIPTLMTTLARPTPRMLISVRARRNPGKARTTSMTRWITASATPPEDQGGPAAVNDAGEDVRAELVPAEGVGRRRGLERQVQVRGVRVVGEDHSGQG